jgi:hypothetical protein
VYIGRPFLLRHFWRNLHTRLNTFAPAPFADYEKTPAQGKAVIEIND